MSCSHSDAEHELLDFSPDGYDERQYCSPAFDLPVGRLTRTPNGRYPEYHTSADDLTFVRPEALGGSLATALDVFAVLDGNRRYLNLNPECEPQLGRRGLFRQQGGRKDNRPGELALLWVLNLSDGRHTLLDIADRADMPFQSRANGRRRSRRRRTPGGRVRVLVTGTQGYIGSLLGPYLVERGHEVVGVDAGFYRSAWLYNGPPLEVQTLGRDIRELTADDLHGFDAVVHMAEFSNDPLGQLAPHVTRAINHAGSVHLASMAKAAGVSRFVYTSSCSVYGAADVDLVDEDSPLRPQTEYAECKRLVEHDVSAMADNGVLSDLPPKRDRLRRLASAAF